MTSKNTNPAGLGGADAAAEAVAKGETVGGTTSIPQPATTRDDLLNLYHAWWLMQLIRVAGPSSTGASPGKRAIGNAWQFLPDQRRASRTSAVQVADLLATHIDAGGNVGLVVPPGVVVLDADDRGSECYLDQLAPDAPKQITGKGGHFWFRLPEGASLSNRRYQIADGISVDLKLDNDGKRGQVVVEPSIHVSGAGYEWAVPLPQHPDDLPVLPDALLDSLKGRGGDRGNREHRENHEVRDHSENQAIPQLEQVQGAIAATCPDRPGVRHHSLFAFARRLKAVYGDVPAFECRPAVVEWHRQALPYIRTKELSETWAEFLIAWPKIRFAHGETLDVLIEKALARPDPEAVDAAKAVGLDRPEMLRLAALCYELAKARNFEPFQLSGPLAHRSLNIGVTTVYRYLAAFCAAGVLKLEKKGEPRPGGKASLYAWAAGVGRD